MLYSAQTSIVSGSFGFAVNAITPKIPKKLVAVLIKSDVPSVFPSLSGAAIISWTRVERSPSCTTGTIKLTIAAA